MELLDCLEHQSWRTLLAIARMRGVAFPYRVPKAEVAARLRGPLADADAVRGAYAALSDGARAALHMLLEADTPPDDFAVEARFGPLNRFGAGDDRATPPWEKLATPTDEVVFRGLAYPVRGKRGGRRVTVFVVPDEVRGVVGDERKARLGKTARERVGAGIAVEGRPGIDRAVFALLSYLNREGVAPQWGRWMPPNALKGLAAHLPHPAAGAVGSSELRSPYVRFVHYLAESAGLVGVVGGLLKPTLDARRWLALPMPGRLRLLWDAWSAETPANVDLWGRYKLPGADWENPPAHLSRLLSALETAGGTAPVDVDAFLDALEASHPSLFIPATPRSSYWEWDELDAETQESVRRERRRYSRAALGELLRGPLEWFEAVVMRDGDAAIGVTGRAALGSCEWPVDPPPAVPKVSHSAVDGGTVVVDAPDGFPLPALFELEEIAPPDPAAPGVYRVTRERLLTSMGRGRSPVDFLEKHAGPLPVEVLSALDKWARDFGEVSIRAVTLLETRDPALMRQLTREKRVRDKLGRTLSARAVCVDSSGVDALVRRLRKCNIVPHVDLPPRPVVDAPADLSEEDVIACAAALSIQEMLYLEFSAASAPPYHLLRKMEASLTQTGRDAVKWAVEDVRSAIGRITRPVKRNYDEHGPPPFPVKPLLPVIEAAIADGATLEIEYHPAGERPPTTRRVDPLRVEERSGTWVMYMVGFCHLRGDNRTFRIDRIGSIRRVE